MTDTLDRCAGCGEVIDPEQDYLREDGVQPRRFHYGHRHECAPPAGLICTLFTAGDPRSWHRERRVL